MQKVWQPAQMQAPELMFPGETTDKVLPAMPSRLSKLYFVIVVIQADVFFQDVVPLLLRLQNASYMKSVNENWSIQKNRRERRFFEKMCFLSVGTFVDFYEMIPWLAITRATLISTQILMIQPRQYFIVSMPSHRQHSFLRNEKWARVRLPEGCQFPHTGNTHFYCTPSNALVLCG